MRQREELCRRLDTRLTTIASQPKKIQEIQSALYEKYGIPVDVANDYLTLRSNINDAEDFMVFVFTEALMPNLVKKHFTETELKMYPQSKYDVDILKFPIRYKMIPVADNQWIGKITVKELIRLRDAQVINYNERTQRTMQRIVSNGTEHYRIALNRKAINAITESFKTDTYIPNTLTLNLPMDADFYYDEDESELVINKTRDFAMDVLDGYHRYIAISNIYNLNRKFDYSMELRIVQFDENKAKQFIWQEDQKTKMRRVDSEAFNQTAIPNKVIARLNADPTFNLAGQISPNEGVINSGELYLCLNTLVRIDPKYKEKKELQTILALTKEYKRIINVLTETDDAYLARWDRKTMIAVTYAAYKGTSDKEMLKTVKKCCNILDNHSELLSIYRQRNSFTGKEFRRLDELMKAR